MVTTIACGAKKAVSLYRIAITVIAVAGAKANKNGHIIQTEDLIIDRCF